MRRDRVGRPAPHRGNGGDAARLLSRPSGAADRWPVWTAASKSPVLSGMPPLRTVLVAVDGTPFGELALPLAAGIARRAGAALRVAFVVSAREMAGEAARVMADARWVSDQRRRRGEYLDGLARRLTRAHWLPVTAALLDGADVADAVCEASAAADLVVMATRRRGSWARYWWGSVSAAVARRARCPVLLVPGRNESSDRPDLTCARLPRDILVPLDGTERGEEAIRAAVALGSLSGAGYDLLHVVRGWAFAGSSVPGGYGDLTPLPGETPEAESHSYLRGAATRLAGHGVAATGNFVVDDRPVAEAIAAHAERTGADLIALTTRGRGPLSRLFRGSVAEDVASRAGVPVLLTRSGDPAGTSSMSQ